MLLSTLLILAVSQACLRYAWVSHMRGYILCQIKRAQLPYYIESISTNIYSIEELCFYLYHNVYLIDKTIINERLCDWIRDELGLPKLYAKLYMHLEKEESMGNFILPIFKEINYLSHTQFKQMQDRISQIESQPEGSRLKLKADYLINNEMYTHAIQSYYFILNSKRNPSLTTHFYASVWSNMGCAYAKLYLFQEAITCFEEAFQLERVMVIYEKYLCALRMTMSEEEFDKKVEDGTIDMKTVTGLKNKMAALRKNVSEYDTYKTFIALNKKKLRSDDESYHMEMKKLLHQLAKNYHRGTCS